MSLTAKDLSTTGSIDLPDETPNQMFSQSFTIPKMEHSLEFLEQMQNMDLSRQMDRSAKIKTASDLRSLRGEDEDKDSEAVRALEQLEIDKINLNIISISKRKKAIRANPNILIENFNNESQEDKTEDLMKIYKNTLASEMKKDHVDEKS